MSTFENKFILNTYQGVLHSDDELASSGRSVIYDGKGNESAIKIGRSCNGIYVCGDSEINGTLKVSGLQIGSTPFLDMVYPVGSLYLSTTTPNPSAIFGGVWIRVSQGLVLVGVGDGVDKNSVSKSFTSGNNEGEYTHTQTLSELATHRHTGYSVSVGASGDASEDSFNTLQGINVMKHENSGHTSILIEEDTIGAYDGEVILNTTGSSAPMNVTQPSFGVYIWERTS